MGDGLVHRQMEGGLVLKPSPKMYDEGLLRREGLGEIVCVKSNNLFDLYVPKESLSKTERTRLVQVDHRVVGPPIPSGPDDGWGVSPDPSVSVIRPRIGPQWCGPI